MSVGFGPNKERARRLQEPTRWSTQRVDLVPASLEPATLPQVLHTRRNQRTPHPLPPTSLPVLVTSCSACSPPGALISSLSSPYIILCRAGCGFPSNASLTTSTWKCVSAEAEPLMAAWCACRALSLRMRRCVGWRVAVILLRMASSIGVLGGCGREAVDAMARRSSSPSCGGLVEAWARGVIRARLRLASSRMACQTHENLTLSKGCTINGTLPELLQHLQFESWLQRFSFLEAVRKCVARVKRESRETLLEVSLRNRHINHRHFRNICRKFRNPAREPPSRARYVQEMIVTVSKPPNTN